MLNEIWKWGGSALLLAGCVWLIWKIYYMFWGFRADYEDAQEKDLKAFEEGKPEDAHRNRDRVLRKARRD